MNQKNLVRKFEMLVELSKMSKEIREKNSRGPLVMIEAIAKMDPSIIDDFLGEMQKHEERFKELQAEWETLQLLEGMGLEIEE